jgi:predicted PurR-regulated permease PerM
MRPIAERPVSEPEPTEQSAVSDRRLADTVLLAERIAVLLLLALLLYGVVRVLQPFAVAIAFGAFIAIGTWPAREALVRRGMRAGAAAATMLLVMAVCVGLPAAAIAPGLADQISAGVAAARDAIAGMSATAPAWIRDLPFVGDRAAALWARLGTAEGNVASIVAPYSSAIIGWVVSFGQAAAGSVVEFLLALIVATVFWTGGDATVASLRRIARRLGGEAAVASIDVAGGAVRGVAWGVVGTAILQAVLMGIGLAIAGISAAAMLAFLTLIFSISQVLGPLIVVTWAGAAAWLYNQGDTGWAIFMLVWGLVMVSSSDNVVRPLMIKRTVTMPLGLIILGVFGGLIAFGFLGLFIGPTLLAVSHSLLRAWQEAGQSRADG